MTSTKRTRDSYEKPHGGDFQDEDADDADAATAAAACNPSSSSMERRQPSGTKLIQRHHQQNRRRSSCIRAGEFFLQQLENQVDLRLCTPASNQSKHQKCSSSPLTLPSMRKLRFKQDTPPPFKGMEHQDGARADVGYGRSNEGDDENDDENDDGFIIHCSQSYERRCEINLSFRSTPENTTNKVLKEEEGDHMMDREQVDGCDDDREVGRLDNTPIQRRKTIECSFPSSSQTHSMTVMKTPTYSVFRNRAERKRVHIIRHGESVYNAIDRYSRSLEDPFVFDAPLTDLGRQQALALKEKLVHLLQPKEDDKEDEILFVASPLTRCIQTMLVALGEKVDEMPAIKVCSHMAEHLATTGDIGRPKSHLVRDFPKIAQALEDLEETWWWEPKKNDAIKQKFDSREPKKHLQKRVGRFRQWVWGQPQKVIVAFGHSTFWKEFSGNGTRLKNCEVDTIYL